MEQIKNKKIAYSIDEISDETTLSKAFLRLEVRSGKLRVKRFGRRVVVLFEDLQTYLEKGSNGNKAEVGQ